MATLIKDQDGKDPTPDNTPSTSSGDGGESSASSGSSLARGSSGKAPPKYPDRGKPVAAGAGGSRTNKSGFFTVYKKGQGKWTRMGTIAGVVLVGGLTIQFLYSERQTFHLSENGGLILCAVFAAAYGLLAFYLMNKPQNADFLIATDSEMKKVNWTSKQELIGSTKVVILFMFAIAAFLFLIDLFFGYFFYLLGVLKTSPFGS